MLQLDPASLVVFRSNCHPCSKLGIDDHAVASWVGSSEIGHHEQLTGR